MFTMNDSTFRSVPTNSSIKVVHADKIILYKRRYLMLLLFCLSTFVNGACWICFAPLSELLIKVNMTWLIYLIDLWHVLIYGQLHEFQFYDCLLTSHLSSSPSHWEVWTTIWAHYWNSSQHHRYLGKVPYQLEHSWPCFRTNYHSYCLALYL